MSHCKQGGPIRRELESKSDEELREIRREIGSKLTKQRTHDEKTIMVTAESILSKRISANPDHKKMLEDRERRKLYGLDKGNPIPIFAPLPAKLGVGAIFQAADEVLFTYAYIYRDHSPDCCCPLCKLDKAVKGARVGGAA